MTRKEKGPPRRKAAPETAHMSGERREHNANPVEAQRPPALTFRAVSDADAAFICLEAVT